MNTIVEHINSVGHIFVEFALPMLIQSSVLIAILLLVDLLLRKKVKAVFRYWIWMLVLLKLILPTSLSSPLSLGYLFGEKLTYQDLAQTSPILEPTEPAQADISPGMDPLFIQPNPYIPPTEPVISVFEPAIAGPVSPPHVPVTPLSWQGVVFLVWLAVVIAMGLLLLQRALFVRGLVAQAKKAGCLMNDALAYCCASMGIKSKVGLKVSVNATTPSVCGLIRPVILMPWNLTSTLGASRLRTILMHELAHIRRGDLWVNLAQTALQIIYFYNPLLWLANCVIRRIREQAVDEAVLVAMGEKARKYPQTLVDVAKMAFKRPALSLRLIGVVESKSALAGRIKHILGRPMPKTAKLGIVGVLAVIIAGAILLPMARAQKPEFVAEGGPDVQVSAQELVAKIIESERKIQDIQLHMTCTIPARNLVFYEYDWGYDSGKESYAGFRNSTKSGRNEISRTTQITRAFDGQNEWSLRVSSEDKQPRGAIFKPSFSNFRSTMTFNTLLGFDAKERSRLSFGEAIAQAESISVRDNVEFIDGHPCYVIEAVNVVTDPSINWAYDVRAWIDYQRDYRLLKFEKCRSISGKNRFKVVSRRVDNIKLKQVDGIWLPVEGRRTTFSTNDTDPPKGMTLAQFAALPTEEQEQVGVFKLTPMSPPRRLEVDVKSIRLNKGIPPERFTVAFPDGCEVYNEFTGKRYVVGELSEREAALSDADWIEQMAGLSVSELIDILRDSRIGKDKKKWFAAVHRLVEIGSAAVPEMVAELRRTEKPQTQSKLALTLRAIGDPKAVPGLIDGLERSGFSSDYGIGEPRTELDMFIQQHQMDPTKKDLGLGRPVREITIALEKLTGHTEGHEHFHAYDLKYDRLGSYTITPEIRDRQRQHRRQVAERWRTWWQANKDNIKPTETLPKPPAKPKPARSEKLERMIMAAPEGSILTLAIVPNVDGSGRRPSLTKEEYQRHVEDLAQNGPFAGSVRGESFQWSPIKGDSTRFRDLPLSAYKDRNYLLLCARAQYVMMPELEGKLAWGLEKVETTRDGDGKPTISIQFDEKGSELLYELTRANIGNHLAIAVDSWVLSAPTVETTVRKETVIAGDFTEEQARTFVEELRKGMTPVDQQTIKAMRLIAEAADKLNKQNVAKMGPRRVVENFLIAGLGGLNEKLRWFVRPNSAVDKILDNIDLSEELLDGHKIKVVNVYVGSKNAFAVTSDITDQYGEQIGQFMFYLSNESNNWLIYDLDAGKADKVRESLTEFLSTHSDVQAASLDVKISAEKPGDIFAATLPNGVTVELVGLFRGKTKEILTWWRPDGDEITKGEFSSYRRKIQDKWIRDTDFWKFEYGYALKLTPSEDVSVRTNATVGQTMHNSPATEGKCVAIVESDDQQRQKGLSNAGDVKVSVAYGVWKGFRQRTRPTDSDIYFMKDGSKLMVTALKPSADDPLHMSSIDVVDNSPGAIEIRVMYELKNGQVCKAWERGRMGGRQSITRRKKQLTPMVLSSFDLPHSKENIKSIWLEYRHYQRLTFKNVSLWPGVKTDVQVEVEKTASNNSGSDSKRIQLVTFKEGMSIREALRFLGKAYKKNIIPSDKVAGQVPVNELYNVTFEETLQAILGAHKYIIDGDFIRVYTEEEFESIYPEEKTNSHVEVERPAVQVGIVGVKTDKVGSFEWETSIDPRVRFRHGWYSVVDGEVKEHIGGGSQNPDEGKLNLKLDVEVKDNMLNLKVQRVHDSANGRTEAVASKTSIPDGAYLRHDSSIDSAVMTNKHLTLWQGDFIRDDKVVKSVIYAAYLTTPDDQETGFKPPVLQKEEFVTAKVSPDVHVGIESNVSPKLVMLLDAINSCAAETDLNIDSISITARNISIKGDTSGRTNTLKFLDAIKKNELEVLQLSFVARDNRNKFSLVVKPKKNWQQWWQKHKTDVPFEVERDVGAKLMEDMHVIEGLMPTIKLALEGCLGERPRLPRLQKKPGPGILKGIVRDTADTSHHMAYLFFVPVENWPGKPAFYYLAIVNEPFEITGVPPGSYYLFAIEAQNTSSIDAVGLPNNWPRPVTVEGDGKVIKVDHVEIEMSTFLSKKARFWNVQGFLRGVGHLNAVNARAEELGPYGRIVDAKGNPVPYATVQVREFKPNRGEREGIAAQDARTNEQGYYGLRPLDYPYFVGAMINEPLINAAGYRWQYMRRNKIFKGKQAINFKFSPWPSVKNGGGTIEGIVVDDNNNLIPSFIVDVRPAGPWPKVSETSELWYERWGFRSAFSRGQFALSDVPAGVCNVRIKSHETSAARGVTLGQREVTVSAGQTIHLEFQVKEWEKKREERRVVTPPRRVSRQKSSVKTDVPVVAGKAVGGEWEDIGNPIPADFNDTIALTEQITLRSIGQDVEGKSFITFVWDKEKNRNRQYRFVLIKNNSTVLEPDSHLILDENGKLEEKFTFDEPHVSWRSVEFKLQSRPPPLAGNRSISSKLQKGTSTAFEGKTVSVSNLAPPGRYAIELDGVDDYLLVPDSPTLRLEPPFTVEMWIKPRLPEQKVDRLQQWGVIAQGGYVGTGRAKTRGFGIELTRFEKEPAKFQISYTEANDGGLFGKDYGNYRFDEWMHISHVFEGGNYKPSHGHPLVVGKFLIPVPEPFMGQIGEIRIWNGAREREEIRRYRDVALTGKEPGLAACWTFEQNEGQFAYDISGNNNHGRLGRSIEDDDADPKWVDLEAASRKPGRIADVQVEVEKGRDSPKLVQLLEELKDDDHIKRENAARKLGELGDSRAVDALIAALKDTDVGVRAGAARALGKTRDKRAVEPLIEAYQDKEYESFIDAIWALGDIGGDRAQEILISALKGQSYHPSEKNIAAKCLTKLGWKPGTREQNVRYLIALESWEQAIKSGPSASLKPAGTNQAEGPFELNIPIVIPLEAEKQTPAVAKCPWLQFSTAQGKLKAALDIQYSSWPHTKWVMKIDVLDAGGTVLGQAKSIHSNSGIIEKYILVENAEVLFEFDRGVELTDAARFRFSIESIWTSRGNPIQFNKELPLALELNSAEQSRTIRAKRLKFQKNGDRVEGTIHLDYLSWPKAKWKVDVYLLDENGTQLTGHTSIIENSGRIIGRPIMTMKDFRFSLWKWRDVSKAVRYSVTMQRMLDSTAKTDVHIEAEGVGAVSGESQVKPTANEAGPRITFESLVCDLGQVAPRTKHSCEFRFTNNGSALLKITKVRSTCGCATSKLKKKEYKPGESGTLEITYQSSASTGRVTKYVYMYSNDKVNPEVKLAVKAEIAVKVAYKPEKLSLLLDKENAGCPAITLTSLDNQPFSITGFKSTADSITADFDSSVKESSFVLKPKVDMEKLGKGLRGNIEIGLTHPECKKITILYDTLSEFKTKPRVIYVREAEPLKPVTKTVSVLSNYNEDVEIESTSSKKDTIKVLTQEKVRNGYQFELQITPPAVESKRRVFTDVFTVVLKGGQQLKVTCYGIYSKKPAEPLEESVSKNDAQVENEQSDEDSEAANAELTVPGPVETRGRISGVVVNSATGEPITGAYVGVGDFGDSGGSNYSRHREQGFHDKTKTDAEGRFELGGLTFTDKHRDLEYHPLVVTHPDFVRHDRKIELPSDGSAPDVKVNLMPAAKIDVTIVDADGNPLEGQWLIRLEALDGRRFIPPGSDPHLSSFASNIWAHMPDLRTKMGVSQGFTFTELDTGEYLIEAIRLHLVDKPTPQKIWESSMTYHGAIEKLKVETGRTKQVQIKPANHQTEVTLKMPETPEIFSGKQEIPRLLTVSRKLGLLLWDTNKVYGLEDPRLGRLQKNAFFYTIMPNVDVFTIKNLPPGSYCVFAGPVMCMSAAKVDVVRGRQTTIQIPKVEFDGTPATVGVWTLDRKVKLQAKRYSVKEIVELLTEKTESNPRFTADPSIENEKFKFSEGQMPIWDVLEKLYLDKGWKVDEGEEKTLVLKPGTKTDVQGEVEKVDKNLYTSQTWQKAFYEAERIIRTRQTWPETPEALAKAFWKTRALKDYKEMEILWPGSGSWNWTEICKNDPAVNYVFGKARKDNPNVPYASEEYFAENQSYNLTMCISSLSTKKGKRYYITSGN